MTTVGVPREAGMVGRGTSTPKTVESAHQARRHLHAGLGMVNNVPFAPLGSGPADDMRGIGKSLGPLYLLGEHPSHPIDLLEERSNEYENEAAPAAPYEQE